VISNADTNAKRGKLLATDQKEETNKVKNFFASYRFLELPAYRPAAKNKILKDLKLYKLNMPKMCV